MQRAIDIRSIMWDGEQGQTGGGPRSERGQSGRQRMVAVRATERGTGRGGGAGGEGKRSGHIADR